MVEKIKAAVISDKAPQQVAEVRELDMPTLDDNKLLVKTIAVAANPVDWKTVVMFGGRKGKLGCDASGVVEKVGANVKGFSPGDIVGAFDRGNNDFERGMFAEYVQAHPDGTIKLNATNFNPDEKLAPGKHGSSHLVNFESLASVPLGLVTISVSFNHSLGISRDKSANKDSYILIWGGATASGVLAIQIAKLVYGLKVITTCSPKNSDFCKSLGADLVFDYHQPKVAENISNAADGNIRYTLDTVAMPETHQATYDSLASSLAVGPVKFDSLLGLNENEINTGENKVSPNAKFVRSLAYNALGDNVTFLRDYQATPELIANHKEFWYNLLPPVLPQIRTANLVVVRSGLESANEALNLLREGKVSAEKVVFRI